MFSSLKILGLVVILFVAGSFLEVMLVSVFPEMKSDMGVTYSALGLLLTTMLVVGTLSQLAWGVILDRRKISFALVVGLGALVSGVAILVGTSICGLSVSGAAILGVGAKCLPLVGLIILVRYLPHNAFGRWLLLPLLLGPLGIALAPVAVTSLANEAGWRLALLVLVLVIAIVCMTLARLCLPSPVRGKVSVVAEAPAVGLQSNKIVALIGFGIVLAITALEFQLLKNSFLYIVHHHTHGPDDLLHARSLAQQHVTESILFQLVGLIISALVADFTRRPGLWIGVGMALSTFASLIFVVFQKVPPDVASVIFSIYWFTLATVKIPVLKMFVQLLPSVHLGLGLGALFVFVDFVSSPKMVVGEWLSGETNFPHFVEISVCIFGLAAGILIFYSGKFRVSGKESASN